MCTRVRCGRCGRPSWVGCGAHVEQVLADVPAAERCRCREERAAARAAARAARTGASRPWWERLIGR